ncbi:MAG TPA: TonB-dependent receptor [Gemmatimonadales bacterium]|nr:TonB-dependent receptor [Gemmatimonadales bacterium]
MTHSRETFFMVLLLVALALLAGVRGVSAQEALRLADRGPHFMYLPTAQSAPRPVDVSRTAVLRQRVALDLDGVSVPEALAEVTRQTGLAFVYTREVLPQATRVNLKAEEITVAAALTEILIDAHVDVLLSSQRQAALVSRLEEQTGSIVGRVTDAKSGQGVPSARVSLSGGRFISLTNDSGAFRMTDVPVGTYTLTVRRIGYLQATRNITVSADQQVAVDVQLEVSVTPLDAVVVTGTVATAQQKELPNPVTVVTDADLKQRGATKINDLFRGELPGLFAADYGAANHFYGAPVYVRGSTELLDVPTLKTYIDGIEIANSQFLNEIDPQMIDHIEIVRGPEASTLYGAQAMNGVMQVFTKRGSRATPTRLTASLGMGTLEGSYATGPQHEDAVAVTGGTAELSFNLGATYRHEGEWTPGHHFDTFSSYGTLALRPTGSPVQVDITARVGRITGQGSGNEAVARGVMDGTLQLQPGLGVPVHNNYSLPQQTIGVTARYTPRGNWRHTFTVGLDRGANGNEAVVYPNFAQPGDSFTNVFSSQSARATAAYNSALDLRLSERVTANVVAGADYWNYSRDSYTDYNTTTALGELGTGVEGSVFLNRQRDHAAGVFTQARFGLDDALFLTAGARVDFGPDLPADQHHRYTAPRVGASYVFHTGPFSTKLRAGYGTALKPALPSYKAFVQYAPDYIQLASPNLVPERQTGWDAGFDLYSGDRASLTVTRYRQLANDLFYWTFGQQGTISTQQIVNVARVRNTGWELEGMLRFFTHMTAKATYSYVESVVDSLAPDDQTGFKVGDPLPGVPNHTGALSLMGTTRRLSIEAEVTYVGRSKNYDQGKVYQSYYPRLGAPDYDGAYAWKTLPATYRLGVRASYDITSRFTLFANGDNLTNEIVYDQGFVPIDQLGRKTLFGLRVR